MNKFMIFHASGVDSNSVHSHDAGTNLDIAAFPTSAITSISADEDYVYLWFGGATQFEGMFAANDGTTDEVMEQAKVRLDVGEGKENTVIKDLVALINGGPHSDGTILFDAVNGVWPISNVEAITIYRTTTTYTIASD